MQKHIWASGIIFDETVAALGNPQFWDARTHRVSVRSSPTVGEASQNRWRCPSLASLPHH
jgi:hypothetical protein